MLYQNYVKIASKSVFRKPGPKLPTKSAKPQLTWIYLEQILTSSNNISDNHTIHRQNAVQFWFSDEYLSPENQAYTVASDPTVTHSPKHNLNICIKPDLVPVCICTVLLIYCQLYNTKIVASAPVMTGSVFKAPDSKYFWHSAGY